jgi:hypothetical protein
LTSILKWSVQCAKELGFWENVVEYQLEMLSPGILSSTKQYEEEKEKKVNESDFNLLRSDYVH